jgi:(2Fe-2S) ferredoxin
MRAPLVSRQCSGEPLVHVTPDDAWYRAQSGGSLPCTYERHVVNGEPIAGLVTAMPD